MSTIDMSYSNHHFFAKVPRGDEQRLGHDILLDEKRLWYLLNLRDLERHF